MFLFDSSFAADLSKAQAEIKRILDRAEAEIVFCRRWDERKLAYEIKGHKRGTYVLTYFTCRPDALPAIERDARLSESVLRVLLLKAEHVTPEVMNQFAPEKRAEAAPSAEREPSVQPDRTEASPEGAVEKVKAEVVASSAAGEDDRKRSEL
jgi:small subunit ribosomal protein S6